MTDWVVLVDHSKDFPDSETPHKVMTVRHYLERPELFKGRRPNILNLARSYDYQSAGYYASLLAEARGQRVLPSVQTMLELSRKDFYRSALPELEAELNRCFQKRGEAPETTSKLLVMFGNTNEPGMGKFTRLLFDWFRAPIVEVSVEPGKWLSIRSLRAISLHRLNSAERAQFYQAIDNYTTRRWTMPKQRAMARWSLAVLHNPREELPPSKISSLQKLAAVGQRMGFEVEPILKSDLSRLAEFDALFIRETTSIDNHTYRFARRAEQEGMPVIDDTVSMIRCTNKVYLKELMEARGVPIPKSLVLARRSDIQRAQDELGFPMVVKIPDGSFSRGVAKVENPAALETFARKTFEKTDLLLAQEFMPTQFDWRVGVLGGEPLFACQYLMAQNHWQIVKHDENGQPLEGGFKTFAVEDAPKEVIDIGVRAARGIGNGLYGVDLKQNERGIFVIEVNDNPNLDHGVEGAVLKDELWRRLLKWFEAKLERR